MAIRSGRWHLRELEQAGTAAGVICRDHRFSAGYPSVEKEGAVSWAGNIRPAPPETNYDLDKSDPVARGRIKESRRAIRIGGVGVRERDALVLGPWDPLPPSPRFSYCTRRALCFALKLTIRSSAVRAVSRKLPPCNHGVLAISDAA
jgi:hypothetical protein